MRFDLGWIAWLEASTVLAAEFLHDGFSVVHLEDAFHKVCHGTYQPKIMFVGLSGYEDIMRVMFSPQEPVLARYKSMSIVVLPGLLGHEVLMVNPGFQKDIHYNANVRWGPR